MRNAGILLHVSAANPAAGPALGRDPRDALELPVTDHLLQVRRHHLCVRGMNFCITSGLSVVDTGVLRKNNRRAMQPIGGSRYYNSM